MRVQTHPPPCYTGGMNKKQEENLTTAEVAERLEVSQRRVVALIKSRQLTARKFGHVWMVSSEDLQKFVATWVREPGRPKNSP